MPVRVSKDVEEFCEVVHIFIPTSRGEHVLGETKYVLPVPIVGVKESLNIAPRTLDRVHLRSSAKVIVWFRAFRVWCVQPWAIRSRYAVQQSLMTFMICVDDHSEP
jgi:hypothetical protein